MTDTFEVSGGRKRTLQVLNKQYKLALIEDDKRKTISFIPLMRKFKTNKSGNRILSSQIKTVCNKYILLKINESSEIEISVNNPFFIIFDNGTTTKIAPSFNSLLFWYHNLKNQIQARNHFNTTLINVVETELKDKLKQTHYQKIENLIKNLQKLMNDVFKHLAISFYIHPKFKIIDHHFNDEIGRAHL